MNLKEIACPRCNKKYFKERNGFSNVFATMFDAGIMIVYIDPDQIEYIKTASCKIQKLLFQSRLELIMNV